MLERILIVMLTACMIGFIVGRGDIVVAVLKQILLVAVMFIGTVIVIKLVANAFAGLVMWLGHIWGMEYR